MTGVVDGAEVGGSVRFVPARVLLVTGGPDLAPGPSSWSRGSESVMAGMGGMNR